MVLTFGLSSSAYALTIIWVSDNKNPSGGATADQGWVDLLRAEGYDVDYRGEGGSGDADYRYWRTLDAAKIAELNAADLIIVSRDVSSGGYDDGDEPTQWSSITAPLILQIAHLVRSNDWNWLNSTSTSSTTANMLAVLPSHPVFAGVTLDASKQVNILASGDADVGAVTDAGNGTVIGTRADTGAVWIAEWEPGVEFYAGAGLYTGGPRMWFAGGGVPDGFYNFNAEGEKLFLNAVRYMLGETGGPGQSSDPKPADQATDVPRDTVLSWTPGEYVPAINGHKVYLSENFNDVNDGIGGITQSDSSYDPGRLEFDTTYYWRVDEVNGPPDYTVYEGDVWNFTTEPIAYPIQNIIATASSSGADRGPENTVNGSGLDDSGLLHGKDGDNNMWLSDATGPQPSWIEYEFDNVYKLHEMWVWNYNEYMEPVLGLGFKDVSIEYSVNGTDYTPLGTPAEFALAPGVPDYAHNTTIDFGGAAAKYIRLTANSNWGGILNQYGLSEVRFFYIPVQAREPSPGSDTTNVDPDVVLSWRAGREAATHDVYVSTDEQAVIDGNAPVISVTEASHGPLDLDLGKTYYWKINEANEAETPAAWEGDLWNFTTREFLIVDDIESYNDLNPEEPESNRIFFTWIDGYDIPTNGSLVGYDMPPFAEQSIVHSDKQSMPLFYDNSGTARYSEAELTLSPAQDWTKHGVRALSLWFHGDPNNAAEQMYVKVNGSKVVYDGDAADIRQASWQQWNIDLALFGINMQNVTKLSIGLGDETATAPGGSGKMLFDDIRLYPSRCMPSLRKPQGDINNDCVVDYLDLELMAGDWLLSDYSLATTAPGPAGLIGYWPFDGEPSDVSGNAIQSIPFGSPLYVVGQTGQAISLDGTTQGVTVNGFSQIQGVPQLTIAMWAKPNVVDDNPDEHTMWFTDETGSYGRIRCRLNDGNWQWQHGDGNANITVTSPATAGVWTHFAGVRSDNDKIELFVDGVSMGTEPFGLHGPHSDESSIGAERRSPTDIRDLFDGLIDDVRVYSRALSAAEVAYLADESPGDGELYVPVPPLAEFYDAEPVKSRKINLKDYAVLVEAWLEEQLWP